MSPKLIIILAFLTVVAITIFFVLLLPRFKIFHRCFLCHHKDYQGSAFEKLKQIEHPGYDTTYHYYHNNCVQKVLNSPEDFIKYVDTAIQIQDQINRNTMEAQNKVRAQIERAKAMRAPKDETIKEPQKQIEPKLLNRYTILKAENNNS